MSSIKDGNGMDLTEADDISVGIQKRTVQKKIFMTKIIMMV